MKEESIIDQARYFEKTLAEDYLFCKELNLNEQGEGCMVKKPCERLSGHGKKKMLPKLENKEIRARSIFSKYQ